MKLTLPKYQLYISILLLLLLSNGMRAQQERFRFAQLTDIHSRQAIPIRQKTCCAL